MGNGWIITITSRAHPLAPKRFLNVNPNVFAYVDTGRHELHVKSVLPSIKYWTQNLKMKKCRLVRKVYNMMLMNENENSWMNSIFFLFIVISL